MRAALLAGAAGLGAAAGIVLDRYVLRALEPPDPITWNGGFIYTFAVKGLWYDPLVGQEARVSDFKAREDHGVGFGATAVWGTYLDHWNRRIPGTGLPALIMRLDPSRVVLPPDLGEKVTAEGFVAFLGVDVFLCCNPALYLVHTTMERPSEADDVLNHPEETSSGLPVVAPDLGVIYDPCHQNQYDPARLVWDTHPNGARYLGANWVWGPAQRGLPVIPVEVQGDRLVGLNKHPEWYKGYCGL
jgi:hypothetical protein